MNQLRLPADTTHVPFDESIRLTANALLPENDADDGRIAPLLERAILEVDLRREFEHAVTHGLLPVRNPLTRGPHPFPLGDALNSALVMVDDLRRFVEGRGITVVVGKLQDTAAPEGAQVWDSVRLYSRLTPRTPWRGSPVKPTDTLTLQDAAAKASEHAGRAVSVGDFLRAGANNEIALQALAHRTVKTRSVAPGLLPLNGGQPGPSGSFLPLPHAACKELAGIGRAMWRTIERDLITDGLPCRSVAWELEPGEPDFEATPDDCRVTGRDVHALADAFTPENDSAATEGMQAAPESADDAPEVSLTCMATRKEILDAFKVWGFKPSWFDNLTDRKWLKNARKRKGQGQRGQVIEPLFCPYEVMQGLVNSVRGERMSAEAGWRALELKFPAAYARFSIGDPREQTG